jgi:hypothetical protein
MVLLDQRRGADMPADVTGKRPLSFSDSTGAQRFVPLSALEFEDSVVQLKSTWHQVFPAADATILLALANDLARSGDFTSPPVRPRFPAIGFKATTPGIAGNDTEVAVHVGAGTALEAPITITVNKVDHWPGLTMASAAMTIGADTEPTKDTDDPPRGTGLVCVKPVSPKPAPDLLPADQTFKVTAATPVVAGDTDKTPLFKLVPRAGYTGTGITVVIATDKDTNTFTVTATHDSGAAPGAVTLDTLDELPKDVGALVEAFAPPVGIALPANSTLHLSGGAPGIAASAVAYTS